MKVGAFEVEVISGGRFRLDGGGMFGVVPRPLWSRLYTPDEQGRIQLDANCLLVRTGDETVLVDTGYGAKSGDKERAFTDLAPGETLLNNLAALGVAPADVTTVLLTHLHMDHVGGASVLRDGVVVDAFPNARYVAQRLEWEDALVNRSHMRTTYRPENLAPLERSGRLVLLDGDTEVVPGIRTLITGGHTRAHQCVFIASQGETLFFPADICPTPAHLRGPYTMAYDMVPYDTIQAKMPLLGQAADEGWIIVFDHEPERKAVRVERVDGQFVPQPLG